MVNEIWKPIQNYEGLYEVSNLGNVRSVKHRDFMGRTKGGVTLKPLKHYKNGYLSVMLWKGKDTKRKSVHRLVATAFLRNPDNLKEVNHKDENKSNNAVSNLEWCDHTYNNRYGTKPLRLMRPVGQYTAQGKLLRVFPSVKSVTEEFHCCFGSIIKVCKGRRDSFKGYVWKYMEVANA